MRATTKTMPIWAVAAIAVAVLAVSASPAPAARRKPVRSGTVTGRAYTWPAMFSGAAWDCESNG